MVSRSSGWASSLGAMLTLIVGVSAPDPTARHAAAWRQASGSDHLLIAVMSRVSIATSRKSAGASRPRTGCCQRSSASSSTMRPSSSATIGW
jgi:hypothetical protein